MKVVTWVLESNVFPETHGALRQAIRQRGHRLVDWVDEWWEEGLPSGIPDSAVVFHGSLGNAARVAEELNWTPGSSCPAEAFRCSAWFESARAWLIHTDWIICPANELVRDVVAVAKRLRTQGKLFVRPDSALKPFSGRVVETAALSLQQLDCGFYYDDESLPVVVAPVQNVGCEWRFVIVNRAVIAGSAYDPATRKPKPVSFDSAASDFATIVARQLQPPADAYVLDVCECDGQLRLLELNPFGGADLYACDATVIVDSVSALAGVSQV